MLGKRSSAVRWLVLTLVLGIIAAAGCGGSTSTVSGTVTYDGKPVENGRITFSPAEAKGQPFMGDIHGGKYQIDKVTPGNYQVSVADIGEGSSGPGSYEDYGKYNKDQAKSYKGGKQSAKTTEGQIPAEASAGLTATVTGGSNTKNFDLPKVAPKAETKGGKR